MSTIKVDGIRSNSASSDAITLASDGTCTAKITNNLSNRNLIINGAMQVAQRGTSSTSSGIATVDRFGLSVSGTDESPTQAQVDVASGTSPYTSGFRKAYKITNGNQTSGAGSSDRIIVFQNLEAQDIANSGWNYTSSSSFITLSFWAKSSVAQTFYVALTTNDGTSQRYGAAMTFASTDTWTKFTYKIPGNSNLTFDNNTERGLQVFWTLFRGTGTTDNSFVLNQWAAYNSSIRYPDITSTWYTTNDATFEITGVQLEVSDHATDFEHRSFAQELELCKRYYQQINGDYDDYTGLSAYSESATSVRIPVQLHPAMRAAFTHSKSGVFRFQGGTNDSADSAVSFALEGVNTSFNGCTIRSTAYSGMGAADRPGNLQFRQNGSKLKFDAEL